MAIILLITLGILALAGVVATLVLLPRDDYRAAPTLPELLRRP